MVLPNDALRASPDDVGDVVRRLTISPRIEILGVSVELTGLDDHPGSIVDRETLRSERLTRRVLSEVQIVIADVEKVTCPSHPLRATQHPGGTCGQRRFPLRGQMSDRVIVSRADEDMLLAHAEFR